MSRHIVFINPETNAFRKVTTGDIITIEPYRDYVGIVERKRFLVMVVDDVPESIINNLSPLTGKDLILDTSKPYKKRFLIPEPRLTTEANKGPDKYDPVKAKDKEVIHQPYVELVNGKIVNFKIVGDGKTLFTDKNLIR